MRPRSLGIENSEEDSLGKIKKLCPAQIRALSLVVSLAVVKFREVLALSFIV